MISKALAFHFNHRSASIAAAIAYVITVLAVMCTATDVDSDDQLNDLFFYLPLGHWRVSCHLLATWHGQVPRVGRVLACWALELSTWWLREIHVMR